MKLIENQAFHDILHLDDADRRHFDQRARQLRAKAVAASISGLKQHLQRFVQTVRRLRAERAAQKALNGLDDRLLTDIGIVRDQIPAVIKGLSKPGTERTPAVEGTRRPIVHGNGAGTASDSQVNLAA